MDTIVQEWNPSKKQERFLSLPDNIFEALYGGGAYGGKTEVLGLLPIIRRFIEHPRFKAILFRRTFPELEKETIPRMMGYYTNSGASWNGTTRCWTWKNGARIFVGHLEHEQDVRKYDTAEFNYVSFDELTSFTEFQYLYLVGSRCRSSFADLPAIARSGTNPGNIGNTWVKERFHVDDVPSLTVIKDKVTGKLRIYIQALPSDNTQVPKEKLQEYLATLEMLPEAEKRAKKYGDWNAFEGQVFPEYRILRLDNEPVNAVHVIEPFPFPTYWPTILAIDWGFTAYFYALWAKISPHQRVYPYREYARKNATIEECGAEIAYLSRNDNIVSAVIDPSAKQKRGELKTIFEQVETALADKIQLHVADNNRISGKMLIHEYLRWSPRPKRCEVSNGYDEEYATKILRMKGLEEYKDYLASFEEEQPEDVKHLPKLQIFNNLPLLINILPACIYDEHNKEDVKEFDGDDPYDTLRYLLKEVDSYVHDVKRAYVKEQKVQEIEQRLSDTKNFHEYFMQMRNLKHTEHISMPNRSRRVLMRIGR